MCLFNLENSECLIPRQVVATTGVLKYSASNSCTVPVSLHWWEGVYSCTEGWTRDELPRRRKLIPSCMQKFVSDMYILHPEMGTGIYTHRQVWPLDINNWWTYFLQFQQYVINSRVCVAGEEHTLSKSHQQSHKGRDSGGLASTRHPQNESVVLWSQYLDKRGTVEWEIFDVGKVSLLGITGKNFTFSSMWNDACWPTLKISCENLIGENIPFYSMLHMHVCHF